MIKILLCMIPSFFILIYVYQKDNLEKEPLSLLIILFLMGVFCCVFSIFITNILKAYFPFLTLSYHELKLWQIIFKILLTIGFIEETTKWLSTYFITWHNKNFKHIYDPIVYCVTTSLGFATLENIIYALNFNAYGTLPIFLRGLFSVPNHAVFGIFMGYYLGLSKNATFKHETKQSKIYKLLSLLIPLYFHFIYDMLLVSKSQFIVLFFIIYVLVCYLLAYSRLKKLAQIKNNFHEENRT